MSWGTVYPTPECDAIHFEKCCYLPAVGAVCCRNLFHGPLAGAGSIQIMMPSSWVAPGVFGGLE